MEVDIKAKIKPPKAPKAKGKAGKIAAARGEAKAAKKGRQPNSAGSLADRAVSHSQMKLSKARQLTFSRTAQILIATAKARTKVSIARLTLQPHSIDAC